MAFCPNCGTPNTDQAEQCASCGFELAPKQKAKFKGTIMMSGIRAPELDKTPAAGQPPAVAPPAAPSPAAPPPASPGATGARNMNYQKTMVGHMAPTLDARGSTQAPAPAPAPHRPDPSPPKAMSANPTMIGTGAQFTKPAQPAPSPRVTPHEGFARAGGPASGEQPSYDEPSDLGYATRASGSSVDVGASTFPPVAASKQAPSKMLAIGCAAALALFAVLGGLLYFLLADRIRAMFGSDEPAAGDSGASAWQAAMGTALANVSDLCQKDCQQASMYFHPSTQASLLEQAKALNSERVRKLNDPTTTRAEMLHNTDDEAIATKLGLDPQHCARVSAGEAKVISCSVPDPTGKPSVMRIVHLSGIDKL